MRVSFSYKNFLRRRIPRLTFCGALFLNILIVGWVALVYALGYSLLMTPDISRAAAVAFFLAVFAGYLVNSWLWGIYARWGMPSPFLLVRYLNGQMRRLSDMREHSSVRLRLLLRFLLKLPGLYAAVTTLTVLMVLASVMVVEFVAGDLSRFWYHLVFIGAFGGYVYSYVAYLSTDLFLGDYRQKIRQLLAAQGKPLPRMAEGTLRSKAFNLIGLMLTGIVLSNALSFNAGWHGNWKYYGGWALVMLFIISGSFILSYILFNSIYSGIRNLEIGATLIAQGKKAWIFSKTSDQELAVVTSEFYDSALKIRSFRDRILAEVNRKTKELRTKNQIIENELDIASGIQSTFLPRFNHQAWREHNVEILYYPHSKVSGDHYNITLTDNNHLVVYLVDAAGHGVPAALITVMAQFCFDRALEDREAALPNEVLSRVNEDFYSHLNGKAHVTAFMARFRRDGFFEYSNAAHPPALLWRSTGPEDRALEVLDTDGYLLGPLEESTGSHVTHQSRLNRGDLLFLYTDGIIEARDRAGREIGLEGLRSLLAGICSQTQAAPGGRAAQIRAQLASLFGFGGQEKARYIIDDDLTCLIVEGR